MKICVLTSKTAREMVHRVIASSKLLDEVDIIDLPVHAISVLNTETIRKIIERRQDIIERMRGSDVVLVPGMVEGDAKNIESLVGRPVYKASRSLAHLPRVIAHIMAGGLLDSARSAEEVMSLPDPGEEYEAAFNLGELPVPRRGPPILLASEIPASAKGDIRAIGLRFAKEGANVIVVGSSYEMSPSQLAERVKALQDLSLPILAESPTPSHARAAIDAGAQGIISNDIEELAHIISDHTVVLGERDWGSLKSLVGRALELGVRKIIVDPIVGMPLLDFSSTAERYGRALSLNLPLWFSAANAQEEIEADSHGVHAVLAVMAVELGVSIYSVVEDSWKSIHSTAEAREALRVATRAFLSKTSERAFYSRLLILKRSERPFAPPESIFSEAIPVSYVEPRLEKGFVRIYVDHERGEIIVEFIGAGGRIVLRGRHPTSLARELIRRAGIGAEHAAYVGYELAKAELALRLGIPYVQDEPVLSTPWDEG